MCINARNKITNKRTDSKSCKSSRSQLRKSRRKNYSNTIAGNALLINLLEPLQGWEETHEVNMKVSCICSDGARLAFSLFSCKLKHAAAFLMYFFEEVPKSIAKPLHMCIHNGVWYGMSTFLVTSRDCKKVRDVH